MTPPFRGLKPTPFPKKDPSTPLSVDSSNVSEIDLSSPPVAEIKQEVNSKKVPLFIPKSPDTAWEIESLPPYYDEDGNSVEGLDYDWDCSGKVMDARHKYLKKKTARDAAIAKFCSEKKNNPNVKTPYKKDKHASHEMW